MAGQSIRVAMAKAGIVRDVIFWPLLFILPKGCCAGRHSCLFHVQAETAICDWLSDLCRTSASI